MITAILRAAEKERSQASDGAIRRGPFRPHGADVHAVCRSALERAVRDDLLRTNPAIGCKLPPKKAKEMQVLDREELQKFLIQAQVDGYYELFLLDLCTGLRRGELIALQWEDLNLKPVC